MLKYLLHLVVHFARYLKILWYHCSLFKKKIPILEFVFVGEFNTSPTELTALLVRGTPDLVLCVQILQCISESR